MVFCHIKRPGRSQCHCGTVTFSATSSHPYPYQHCYCSICRKTQGDGHYLKYFRRKHLISRDLMVAAAVRFARHSRRLIRMQIPTLTVLGLHRNWLHFLRTRVDWPHLSRQLIDAVLAGYRDASRLPAKDLQRIADHAERVHTSTSR